MELFGLVTLLFGAKLGGTAFKKLGQPSMVGELLAGLLLGPSVLSFVTRSSLTDSMAEVGLVFLVLLISMSIDWSKTRSDAGMNSALEIIRSTLTFGVVFLVGVLFGWGFYETVIIGMVAVLTSTAIISRTLTSTGHIKSSAGQTMMSLITIGEVAGMMALIAVAGFVQNASIHIESLIFLAAVMSGFFLLVGRTGDRLVNGFTTFIHKHGAEEVMLGFTLILAFAFSALVESLNFAALLGIFFAGALLSRSSHNTSTSKKVREVGEGFFTPFFFASIGLGLNLLLVQTQIYMILAFVAALICVKWACTTLTFRMFRFSMRDSVKIGSGMTSLSELTVVIAAVAFSAANPAMLSIIVTVFVITNMLSPFITSAVFRSGTLSRNQFFKVSGENASYNFRKE
jgi:Kef-type K+ transport system membrane component KefB